MQKRSYQFSNSGVDYFFNASFSDLKQITDPRYTFIITDENVFQAHTKRFKNWNTIVLKPGEAYKVQATVDTIIQQLIAMGADRTSTLVGVGGGVVTDLTGYVASIYMRGIRFGFIPTSVLAMVDASIGGKNGIDIGIYKNMVGVIRQPSFLLYDLAMLQSLPQAEWENGFAEIIKHACIKDASMFRQLEEATFRTYRSRKQLLGDLIKRNALLKTKVVQLDEFEKGDRKLLNFGHTLGHAIENMYELAHGHAISIGMTYACHISESLTGFKHTARVTSLLEQYGLPTYASFDRKQAFENLLKDKKKVRNEIGYVLLERIGKAVVHSIGIEELRSTITNIEIRSIT